MALWSAKLDEAGTDGRSDMTLLGGAVGLPRQWDTLEASWGALLGRSGLTTYHWQDFRNRRKPFADWSKLKRDRFLRAQERLIRKHTLFRVAISVESSAHADVKKKMMGIKGFSPESDYGLCLRVAMFKICESVLEFDPHCQLEIMVEDGPWASGAAEVYERVAAMTGKRKPAKHAHRLAGFTVAPKGQHSLEVADYIAGAELARLHAKRASAKDAPTLCSKLDAPVLESWYEGMIAEKEIRREYARRGKS